MAWIYLLLAGVCEMIWPLGFKYTHGFTVRYWAIGGTFAVLLFSLWLMAQATHKGIPIGTAYAVWTALGATGTAIVGILAFGESRELLRLSCLGLIILGVVGLKFLPAKAPAAENVGDVRVGGE